MPEPVDDSLIFIEQARWLLGWHNARSEAFTTRAVAVLGFDGLILALLLQGFAIGSVESNDAVVLFVFITAALLLISAGFSLATIFSRKVAMPKVDDLRKGWKEHSDAPMAHYAGPLVAESLLHASDLSVDSPVSSAVVEADARACLFSWAVVMLLGAVVSLGVLAFVLLSQL